MRKPDSTKNRSTPQRILAPNTLNMQVVDRRTVGDGSDDDD